MKPACTTTRRVQRGLSLVEVAVAMVVMGVAATASWQTILGTANRDEDINKRALLERSEAALLAFVAVKGYLPCPAAQPDGWEDTCNASTENTGLFPYRTVGMPEPKAAKLQYQVKSGIGGKGVGNFGVLVNTQDIKPGGKPKADPTALRTVAANASTPYDGMLDLCEALNRVSVTDLDAFSLKPQILKDAQLEGDEAHVRVMRASQLSSYLSCAPMVTIGGRGHYVAHLAASTMGQTLKDYKDIYEIDYGTYALDLAEGLWTMSDKFKDQVARMPKTWQALSKFDASRFTSGWAEYIKTFSQQITTLAALGAQISNVERFRINLVAAKKRYGVIKDLDRRSQEAYQTIWKATLLSSSSAYFLAEQMAPPGQPTAPGLVSTENGPSGDARILLSIAQDRAESFDQGKSMKPFTNLETPMLNSYKLPIDDGEVDDWDERIETLENWLGGVQSGGG